MATRYFLPLSIANTNDTIQYGNKQITFTTISTNSKLLRSYSILKKLQKIHILPKDINIESEGISHVPEGKNFSRIQFNNFQRYVSPSIFYKGKKVTAESTKWEEFSRKESTLIIGICLFGISGVIGFDIEKGNKFPLAMGLPINLGEEKIKIKKISINSQLHPYEIEYFLRMIPVIEKIRELSNAKIYFHIPRLEYQLYGLYLYQKKIINKYVLNTWIKEVNIRSMRIEDIITGIFDNLSIVSPLVGAKKVIEINDSLSLIKLIELLVYPRKGFRDKLWEKLIEKDPPQSFLDIINKSYIYSYLQLVKEDQLLIAIEDPVESKILSKTAPYMKDLNNSSTIIGLYVHPEIIPNNEYLVDGKLNDLFYFDQTKLQKEENNSSINQIIEGYIQTFSKEKLSKFREQIN